MIWLDRAVCTNLEASGRREWLVTNGIGGCASGTAAGMLSRSYHGLLVAAMDPPLGRTLLVAGVNETVRLRNAAFPLYTTQTAPGVAAPQGYTWLESFRLQGAIPVWTYNIQGARLDKWIWMQHAANTTYVQYRYIKPAPQELEDHFCPGSFSAALNPGDSLTLIFSTDPQPLLNGDAARRHELERQQNLFRRAILPISSPAPHAASLVLAADQFIVHRPSKLEPQGSSIIAGYPWFGDWGRDTMISLPGLTLVTGRPDTARRILRTFAGFVDQGMLPNRFPDEGQVPEYNTVDAALWYFEALRQYLSVVHDHSLLEELYPVLLEVYYSHQRGTRYNIHVDPDDGLLYAGEEGLQLTWMDARYGDWVVTPRTGKPVEINALWYNALKILAGFSHRLDRPDEPFEQAAWKARQGFARFWNAERGCCYDVIDGPSGCDPLLRPNQIFAVSLPPSPLDAERQRRVVDICAWRQASPVTQVATAAI